MINFTGAGDEVISQELVSETWGLAPYDRLLDFIESIADKQSATIIDEVRSHINEGKDVMALIADLAEMMRNSLLIKKETSREYLTESLPEHLISRLKETASRFTETELTWMFNQLLDLHRKLQVHSRFRLQLVEVEIIRIIEGRPRYNMGEIIDRLESMENNVKTKTTAIPRKKTRGKNTESKKVAAESAKKEVEKKAATAPKNPVKKKTTKHENAVKVKEKKQTQEPDTIWEEILEAVPVQTRAYLRNYNRVEEKEDSVFFWFDPQWENHVQQLRDDKHLNSLQGAIEEKTGKKTKVKIMINNGETGTKKDKQTSEKPDNRLLEQAKDIFQVDSVKKIKR
jgi:DNA polymerase III gamma/tau subunit